MKTKRRIKLAIVYVIVILLSASFLLPLLWMVRSSFMELTQIFELPPRIIPEPFQFQNYADAMSFAPFGRYFINTFTIVILNIIGVLLTSSLAAFSFSRIKWKGRDIIFGILLTAMMLPGAVMIIPTFLGWQALGFYNTYAPLIVPAFFGGGAFNIFLLRQFFMTIPQELDEAARVDGASYLKIYLHIILPLSRSALIVVGLFSFLASWNDFFGPLIYLNDENLYTLALGLQHFQGSYNAEWSLLMAASAVVILPCIIVFMVCQKYFIKGITLTGLKG
ncbi:MAG TPA: carbohydrate ABC transporter permease [Bacillaceae bacterium]|nr:carbohydrate ABC transporter permease [Bacillaceae bacterium]